MKILYRNGKIYRSEEKRFVSGSVAVDGGVITNLFFDGEADGEYDEIVDLCGARVAPGFIDVHTHGRIGGDFNRSDKESIMAMSDSYKKNGVTGVMATLATASYEELQSSIEAIADIVGESVYLGVHLEGRYLNKKRKGAHAASLLVMPNADEIEVLVSKMKRAGYAHVSAALELDEDGKFTEAVLRGGATLGLAHSDATYAEGAKAFERGAVSLTHTYNAMSPIHHRDVGAVGAGLLTDGVYCELICDGFHVSPEAVRMAYMLKNDRIVLITDSIEATGMPDGEYGVGALPVTVKDGKARLEDGTIAGSTLTLPDGVKNLSRFAGISYAEALYCATASPAKMIGAYDYVGSLDIGKWANMLILDEEYNVKEVIFRGKKI